MTPDVNVLVAAFRDDHPQLLSWLAATFPRINAVVAYAPSGVVHGAVDEAQPGSKQPPQAAWTWRGEPVAYLQQNGPVLGPEDAVAGPDGIIEAAQYFTWLRNEQIAARAEIPVERIAGPVLMISGKDDALWPSFELGEIARRRLQRHGHPWGCTHLAYEAAGHHIVLPAAPTTESRNKCEARLRYGACRQLGRP